MKERRQSREIAMQILFLWEAQGLISRQNITECKLISDEQMGIFLGQFLHNFYSKDQIKLEPNFIIKLVNGALSNIIKIDSFIDKSSNKWRIERMGSIDRAILRLACFELVISQEISAAVIINEAIELAKRYGSEQSAPFVNAVLDNIKTHVGT